MIDSSLAEILRSPLDDLPPKRQIPPWAAFVVAAIVGLATTLTLFPDRSVDLSATTTVATSTTTTVAVAPRVLTLANGTMIDQLLWWDVADGAAVLVTASVPPGVSPEEADPVISGLWDVVLDDGRVVPGRTAADIGASVVEFTGPGVTLDQLATLRYRPPIEATEATVEWTEEAIAFPWTPQPGTTLDSLGSASLVLDEVRFDDMGGEIVWHIEGDDQFLASLDVDVTYTEDGSPERIASRFGLPTALLQFDGHASPPVDGDVLELFHLDDPVEPTFRSRFWGDPDPVDVEDVTVTWSIVFARYASEPIEAPVEAG